MWKVHFKGKRWIYLKEVDEYTDFSFLKKKNFDEFIQKVKKLSLSQEERERLKEQREREIDASLVKLNNDIYKNEKNIDTDSRIYLVAASIIATIGIPNKVVPLEKSMLESSDERGNRDGDIILRKITAFLDTKDLPQEKKAMIIRTLENTLTNDNMICRSDFLFGKKNGISYDKLLNGRNKSLHKFKINLTMYCGKR